MVGRRDRGPGKVPERMSERAMNKLTTEVVLTGRVKWKGKTHSVDSVRKNGKVNLRTPCGRMSVDPRHLRSWGDRVT